MLRRMLHIALLAALLPLNAMDAEQSKIAFQEALRLPDSEVSLQFVGYVDERCPADVRCISAGRATAIFRVAGGGEAARLLELTWPGEAPAGGLQPVEVAGYRVALQALEPRPLVRSKVDANRYVATVVVTRR